MHISLLALYGLGGWLVHKELMPIRTLLSAIGFTFSLVFATQGAVQTFAELRRATAAMRRSVSDFPRIRTHASLPHALPVPCACSGTHSQSSQLTCSAVRGQFAC